MTTRASIYVPFGPDLSVLDNIKLCKNCKYFIKEPNAKCGLFGAISLIDGNIDYKYATSARSMDCKGNYYSEVSSSSTLN